MARGRRGESGQRAPRACSRRPGERSGEGRVLGEAPTALPGPPQRLRGPRTSSSSYQMAAGWRQGPVVSATAKDPAPHQHAPPFPLCPARSRPTGAEAAQRKARPPGTELRSSTSRSARSSSIPGGRGRARGRSVGAIQRGSPGMLFGRSAAAVRLPAPASAAPRAAAGRAQSGLPARAPAWLGAAGPALCGRGEAGARTLARRRQGARESGLGAE